MKKMVQAVCATAVFLGVGTAIGRAQDAPPQNITKPPRWAVMTGTDADIFAVNKKASVKTTVEKLRAVGRPEFLPTTGDTPAELRTHRVAPTETTIWMVGATLVEAHLNPDGDYRVTLRGKSGQILFGELPDPALMKHPSPFAARMNAARRHLQAKLGKKATPLNIPLRLSGLGYFGRTRPGNPGPSNGLQLHPVLDIDFR